MNIKKSIFMLTLFPLLLNTNMLLAMDGDEKEGKKNTLFGTEKCTLFRTTRSLNLCGFNNREEDVYKGEGSEDSFNSSADEENYDSQNDNSQIEEIRKLLRNLPSLSPHDPENDKFMKEYIDANGKTLVSIKNIISNISDEKILSEIFYDIMYDILFQFEQSGTFNELLFGVLPDEYKLKFIEQSPDKIKTTKFFIYGINNYLDRCNANVKLKHKISKEIPVYQFIEQDMVNDFFENLYFNKSSFDTLSDKYKQKFIVDILVKSSKFYNCDNSLLIDTIIKNRNKFETPIHGIIVNLYLNSEIKENKNIYINVKKLFSKFNFRMSDINVLKHVLRHVYK